MFPRGRSDAPNERTMLRKELKLPKPTAPNKGKPNKGGDAPKSPCDGVNGGRDNRGRFGKGNTAARGNPFNNKVAEWRDAVVMSVDGIDVQGVMRAMVKAAIGGDVAAARVVLERTLGRVPTDLDEFRLSLEKANGDDRFD